MGSIQHRDLAKHILTLVNSSGGLLAIGVEDNGTVSGSTFEH